MNEVFKSGKSPDTVEVLVNAGFLLEALHSLDVARLVLPAQGIPGGCLSFLNHVSFRGGNSPFLTFVDFSAARLAVYLRGRTGSCRNTGAFNCEEQGYQQDKKKRGYVVGHAAEACWLLMKWALDCVLDKKYFELAMIQSLYPHYVDLVYRLCVV